MDVQSATNADITVALLRSIGAFREMSPEQLAHLAGVMLHKTYEPGQIIFLDGEASIGLWFVANGQVKIVKQAMSGRILSLCIMRTGTCFGSCPLFSQETNPATAEALTQVTLVILPQRELDYYRKRDPLIAQALLRIYSQRFAHLARLSEGLATWTVGERINDTLLTYADTVADTSQVLLTHEKLADLAGTARELVTRHLTQLEHDGVVRVEPGKITILNPAHLRTPCQNQD
jgi:CRP/FNR family transcriptional regulator